MEVIFSIQITKFETVIPNFHTNNKKMYWQQNPQKQSKNVVEHIFFTAKKNSRNLRRIQYVDGEFPLNSP